MENNKPTKEELQSRVDAIVSKIENKDFNIYFYCTDTKGNPVASVQQIYEHVNILNEAGYKAFVLYDNDDYTPVTTWLPEKYEKTPILTLTHKVPVTDPKTKKVSFKQEPTDIKISTIDYLILPEAYANIMEQLAKTTCNKVVFCQNYTFISEILPLDKNWGVYGFNEAITTSVEMKEFLSEITPATKTSVVPVVIEDETFTKGNLPAKPYIAFITKDQTEFRSITSKFYRKYPAFRWFTPIDLRSTPQEQYADTLKQCCVTVWVDRRSSFGTAPLEAMKCGVPVIGVIPDLLPGWMKDETTEGDIRIKANGVWVGSILEIGDVLANFCQIYLEGEPLEEINKQMLETVKSLGTTEEQRTAVKEVYIQLFNDKIGQYKDLLNK